MDGIGSINLRLLLLQEHHRAVLTTAHQSEREKLKRHFENREVSFWQTKTSTATLLTQRTLLVLDMPKRPFENLCSFYIVFVILKYINEFHKLEHFGSGRFTGGALNIFMVQNLILNIGNL